MEDEIRTLLHEAAPQPSAPAAFRMELNARLSAVEQIKTYRDREYRRNQRKLRIVFVTGILLGAVLVLLALSSPFDLPNLSFFDISDISKYNGLRFVLTALGAGFSTDTPDAAVSRADLADVFVQLSGN